MTSTVRQQPLRKGLLLLTCAWIALTACGPASAGGGDDPTRPGFYPGPRLSQPDGRLLVGGGYSSYTEPAPYRYSFAIERLNADGTPDTSFNGTGFARIPIWGYYEFVSSLVIQPDGKIVVGGNAADPIGWGNAMCYPAFCKYYPALIRLNVDGTLDRSFNGNGRLVVEIGDANRGAEVEKYGTLTGLALQPDGKIVILDGTTATARVNADGTLDLSFVGTEEVAREITDRYPFGTIGAGFTGTWFNPSQNGHGFMLEVLPGTPMRLLAVWFMYAPEGGQSWVVGLGQIDGNRAVLQGIQPVGSGARFPPNFDQANVRAEVWGTLTFAFSDCNHGHVDWTAAGPRYGSGSMELIRLTQPAELTCWP